MKTLDFIGIYLMLPQGVQLLAGTDFQGAQAVLVEVVAIDGFGRERSIAVPFPTAAKVQFVVDAPDAVAAAEHESQGIVLAVTGIGYLYFAQYGGEEGAWGPQAVDAQGIVAAVGLGPFAVVDEAGGQGLELEVAHAVRTDDHGGPLLIEGVHDALQGVG